MQQYEELVMEVIEFESGDVLTDSNWGWGGEGGDGTGGTGGEGTGGNGTGGTNNAGESM